MDSMAAGCGKTFIVTANMCLSCIDDALLNYSRVLLKNVLCKVTCMLLHCKIRCYRSRDSMMSLSIDCRHD